MSAEQVFAIPELLEDILLRTTDHKASCSALAMRGPVTTLFTLQRVSKTFQATIQGSKKLQRLMFLTPSSATPERAAHYEYKVGHDEDWSPDHDMMIVMHIEDEIDPSFEEPNEDLIKFEAAGGTRPEASWRRMRASWSSRDQPLRFGFQVTVFSLGVAADKEFLWEFGPEENLGHIFDTWHGIFKTLRGK